MVETVILGIVFFWVIFITKEVFFSDINSWELVSVFKDLAIGVSAIVVAIQGTKALSQWRHELLGKSKFDGAKRLVILLYEFENAYHYVRSPITFSGEFIERDIPEGEDPELKQHYDPAFLKQNRLKKLLTQVIKLDELFPEAEILLGQDMADFKELYTTSIVNFRTRYNSTTSNLNHILSQRD